MVISSRVVACTSQPVAFNGHLSTHGCLTGLRNKPQQKQTCQHLAVVYWQFVSLLMELSIDGEKCPLTWCVKVAGFGKAGHIFAYSYTRLVCTHSYTRMLPSCVNHSLGWLNRLFYQILYPVPSYILML